MTSPRRAEVAAPLVRRRYSRLDWLLLRWQARLDARWADRVVPWVAATVLFVVYFTAAIARVDRLEAGDDLARSVQAAWQLADAGTPRTTIGAEINFFALRLPIGFIPLAVLTRFLPITGTLLAAQSASLALGVVPLWHLARKVVNLRVGAAAALVLVYAWHPAVADLDLADFHPTTMALTPLLVAAYSAERKRWWRFAAASIIAVAFSSELGLVIATLGVVLFLEGQRRVGALAAIGGLGWTAAALALVQAPLGTGLVGAGAFDAYGDSGLDVVIEMLRNPFGPLIDLLAEENLRILVWVLAPLLFLPVLAFRKLVPALPLQSLYFIAEVPLVGADGGARTVALVAFAFVAAPFALARLGRRSIERVLVDRRLLVLMASAALAALVTASPLGPHSAGWSGTRPGEADLRVALEAVPPGVRVRAPEALVTELAERRRVELLDPAEARPSELTNGIDALVLDESTLEDLDDYDLFLLRRRIEDRGFVLAERAGEVDVFLRMRP